MADPFEVELEQLVAKVARDLARDITALILRRLGISGASAGRGALAAANGEAPARRKRAASTRGAPAAKGAARPKTRTRATREERDRITEVVERVVSASPGLSVGQIERQAALSRGAVGAALKALKDQGRAFMGGTKRFARYASTQAQADRASLEARRSGE